MQQQREGRAGVKCVKGRYAGEVGKYSLLQPFKLFFLFILFVLSCHHPLCYNSPTFLFSLSADLNLLSTPFQRFLLLLLSPAVPALCMLHSSPSFLMLSFPDLHFDVTLLSFFPWLLMHALPFPLFYPFPSFLCPSPCCCPFLPSSILL